MTAGVRIGRTHHTLLLQMKERINAECSVTIAMVLQAFVSYFSVYPVGENLYGTGLF